VFGFVVNGLTVPGQDDTDILQAVVAIPGALLGMAIVYWIGMRQERAAAAHA
jgi:membrane protein DedA with SNARE-associated domain